MTSILKQNTMCFALPLCRKYRQRGRAVSIANGGNVQLGGVMYFPNVAVTWSGNVQNANTDCTQVIANSLTITGNSYLSSAGCADGTVPTTQAVALVE